MIYLIDFENVHEEGFASLGRLGDRDAVYCFFTKNVAKISMAALAGMRSGQLHFIEAESGKQSLDLALVSYLGYLIGTVPNEQCYEIVSNDNGFAKAADFWNKHRPGLRVRVRKTVDQTKTETKAPAKSASKKTSKSTKSAATPAKSPASLPEGGAPAGAEGVAPAASAKPAPALQPAAKAAPAPKKDAAAETQTPPAVRSEANPSGKEGPAAAAEKTAPAAPAKPNSKPTAKSLPQQGEVSQAIPRETVTEGVNPEAVAALVAAGIEAPVAEFLLTEAEKYRDDKNIKQLVYRAVVKKYGQKQGTQIYNTAKKVAL